MLEGSQHSLGCPSMSSVDMGTPSRPGSVRGTPSMSATSFGKVEEGRRKRGRKKEEEGEGGGGGGGGEKEGRRNYVFMCARPMHTCTCTWLRNHLATHQWHSIKSHRLSEDTTEVDWAVVEEWRSVQFRFLHVRFDFRLAQRHESSNRFL